MEKKKIIRATTVPMSLKAFCDGMLKELSEKYEVVAVSSPGEDLDWVAEHEGVRTIAVSMERHISLWNDLKSLIQMIGVFRREKPNMVHSMTPKAGLVYMVAGWLTRVPVRVHTFTGLVWPTSTGLKRKILMLTDKILCACATHIIPEGQGVMDDLRNGGITKKPMKVLGYGNVKGVDLKIFDPKRFKSNDDDIDDDNPNLNLNEERRTKDEGRKLRNSETLKPFTFIFVGRIVGDKGVNELVEAFTQLHDKYQQTKLVLVGPYEEHLDPVSELTLNRIKANPAIETVGKKFGDDLLVEYMKSDCHVLPSYREGFPNTPMEAGALGLPNIVTDINGSREIVGYLNGNLNPNPNPNDNLNINGIKICDNGIIVPPRTIQPLYDAMERMVTDTAMRERMQKNARPMIESRFEKGFVRKCLYDFYDEIM